MTVLSQFGSIHEIKNKMKLLITLLGLGLTTLSFGQTISTEAPSVSASAVTVPKNGIQFESTFGASMRQGTSENTSYLFSTPSLLMRYGIAEKFELRATAVYNIIQPSSGVKIHRMNGVGIGGKYEILNKPDGNTQMAIIAHANLYNQNSPFVGGSLLYALSHSFTDQHSIGFNAGIGHSLQQQPNFYEGMSTINYSLIYNFQFNEIMCVFGEFYGSSFNRVVKEYSSKTVYGFTGSYGFDLGFLFLLQDNIQLDFAAGTNEFTFDNFYGSLGFNILLNTKK